MSTDATDPGDDSAAAGSAASRLFAAIALAPERRAALAEAARELVPRGWRLARPENLHLTLRFLGDTPPERVGDAAAAIEAAAAGVAPFALRFDGFGVFPSPRSARVAWFGVVAPPALVALAAAIERELVARGFAPEPRPFAAHVTVARCDGRSRPFELPTTKTPPLGEQSVEAVTLFASERSPAAIRYVSRAEASLRGR